METFGIVAIVAGCCVVFLGIFLIISLLCPRRRKSHGPTIAFDEDFELIKSEIPKKCKMTHKFQGKNTYNVDRPSFHMPDTVLPVPPQPIPPPEQQLIQPISPGFVTIVGQTQQAITPFTTGEPMYAPVPQGVPVVQYPPVVIMPIQPQIYIAPPENVCVSAKKYKKRKKYQKVYYTTYYISDPGYSYGSYHHHCHSSHHYYHYSVYRLEAELMYQTFRLAAHTADFQFHQAMRGVSLMKDVTVSAIKAAVNVGAEISKVAIKQVNAVTHLAQDCCTSCMYCKCCNGVSCHNCSAYALRCDNGCCKDVLCCQAKCCKDAVCTQLDCCSDLCKCVCENLKDCSCLGDACSCLCGVCKDCHCENCLNCSGEFIKGGCDCLCKSRACCDLLGACCNKECCNCVIQVAGCCCQILAAFAK